MARRKAVIPERVEQAHIVQLLRSLGGKVYVLGTHRRRGDFQGTMQTPGIADLFAFLPVRPLRAGRRMLAVECKAKGGRLRPEQLEFRALCLDASIAHVVGGLGDVIEWLIGEGYLHREQVPHYRRPAETTTPHV